MNQFTQDVHSPVHGRVQPIAEVADPVFAAGLIGPGFAVVPETPGGGMVVVAPVAGHIAQVARQRHALVLRSDGGAEVLVHCGIDTVKQQGAGFEVLVAEGEVIAAGDTVLRVDAPTLRARGYDLTIVVTVMNHDRFTVSTTAEAGEELAAGQRCGCIVSARTSENGAGPN